MVWFMTGPRKVKAGSGFKEAVAEGAGVSPEATPSLTSSRGPVRTGSGSSGIGSLLGGAVLGPGRACDTEATIPAARPLPAPASAVSSLAWCSTVPDGSPGLACPVGTAVGFCFAATVGAPPAAPGHPEHRAFRLCPDLAGRNRPEKVASADEILPCCKAASAISRLRSPLDGFAPVVGSPAGRARRRCRRRIFARSAVRVGVGRGSRPW